MKNMSDTDDAELLDAIYGVQRDEPCVYGHFDCAEYDGGPCANETYAQKLSELHDTGAAA